MTTDQKIEIPPEFETKISVFSSGYNWREKLAFLKNRIKPSQKYRKLTPDLPRHARINNDVNPRCTIGLVGDLMPVKDFKLRFGDDVKAFFADCDYLLVNLEGIITQQKRLLALNHRPDIINALGELFQPERTLIYCANNHAGDFGYAAFKKQYDWLKTQFGFVIGAHDDAATRLGEINVAAFTMLSNQPCPYTAWLDQESRWYDQRAAFNLLLPHWGYEMQRFPHPAQIRRAQELLQRWNLIAGNHSHCPQPAAAYHVHSEQRAVVYSMGNLCYHHRWPHHRFGKLVKVRIGQNNSTGLWQTGELFWTYSRHDLSPSKHLSVSACDRVKY